MEEMPKSTFKSSFMPGILVGLALIVFELIMYLLDVDRESWIKYLAYLVMAGGIYWAATTYRDKQLGGFISFGQAFGSGFWTAFFASVISAIFTYIYVTMIDPGMIEEILLTAEERMLEQNPNMSDEQLEQALNMTEMFTSGPMITAWVFIFNLLASAVLSLIIAIFVKRENQSLA